MARAKKPATTGDLIRSLLVIIIPLVIITLLFTNTPRDHPVKVVDWVPVLTTARTQAPFPVLAPTSVPAGWRATQVSWVKQGQPGTSGQISPRNQWELDFLDADDMFIGLSQGDGDTGDFVKQETRAGTADGSSVIGGQTWDRVISPDERTRSLVRRDPAVTTVVSGDLGYAVLEAYAVSLAPR